MCMRSSSTPKRSRSSTSRPCGCCDELAEDLQSSGVRLALAHEIGQVRDVMRRGVEPESGLAVYPTVKTALEALRQE